MRKTLRDSYPRIGHGVRNIGHQVADQRQNRPYEQYPHNHGIIPRHDGHVKQLSHPRYGKYCFEYDASADEPGNGKAQNRDYRKERVPESVLVDNDPFAQSLGPGGGYIILPYHFQHVGSHVSRESREPPECGEKHRQYQVLQQIDSRGNRGHVFVIQRAYSRYGEPAEMHTEQYHQQKREPESRHRESQEYEYRSHLIEERILAHRGKNAYGNGYKDNERHRKHVYDYRNRYPLQYLVYNRPVIGGERFSQIECGKFSDP